MEASSVRYFVYELRDPRPKIRHPETLVELAPGLDPRTFYVGKSKTSENRLRRHLNQAAGGKHPCHRCHLISQIIHSGLVPELVIVASYDTEVEALAEEANHASHYPKNRLTNILEAGTTGWSHSPEARARMAERMAGFKMPAHVREAQRRAATGRPKTVEEIEKIRVAMKGRPLTEAHRAAVTAGVRARDPEVYARIGAALRGHHTKLTAAGIETIVEMRQSRHRVAEIASAVGLSTAQVYEIIRQLITSGRLPRPANRQDRLARAAEIYDDGGGVDDVVEALALGARSTGYAVLRRAWKAGFIKVLSERPYRRSLPSRPKRETRPSRRPHQRIPESEWPVILDLLGTGQSHATVARQYGVTRPRIGQIARAASVALGRPLPTPQPPARKLPRERWVELARLCDELGLTQRQAARQLGISPALACRILAELRRTPISSSRQKTKSTGARQRA